MSAPEAARTKAYWFDKDEHDTRLARIQSELAKKDYDGLLAFMPETVTWTTGYFTRGYGTFQFAIIPATGEPTIVCRDVEVYYVETTSLYPDAITWTDTDNRAAIAAQAIRSCLGEAPRLAVELAAWPLTAARFAEIKVALPNAVWSDETQLVARLRLIKSSAEIALQRRAAQAAEAGMRAAIDSCAPGVSERDVAAETCAAMIRAGSDLPGPGVMSSGERAYHLHGGYSDRVLEAGDIVQIETTPNVKHYHARFMRPIRIARASDEDYRLAETLVAIQDAALEEVRPGAVSAVADAVYRDGVLSAGLRTTYTNKTFYSVGLLLHPNGGEPLEATKGSAWTFAPGMTFHTYVLARGFGMSETIAITHDGFERLTNFTRRLFVSASTAA